MQDTARLELAGIEIEAVSAAGLETCIQVPSWDLCFDIGRCPPTAVKRKRVLFTHGHIDHMGGVAHHASLRDMWGMAPPEYWVPEHYSEAFGDLLSAWRRLDHSDLPCRVRTVAAGDEIVLSDKRRVSVFQSIHRVNTVGYALIRRSHKLLPELVGLPGPEIARRRQAGEAITSASEAVEVVFCGDTTIDVVDREPLVRQAKVLVLECTFLDDRVDLARVRRTGHIHLGQIAERADLFDNEAILLTHFSARYSNAQIAELVHSRLPAGLRERVTALPLAPPWIANRSEA